MASKRYESLWRRRGDKINVAVSIRQISFVGKSGLVQARFGNQRVVLRHHGEALAKVEAAHRSWIIAGLAAEPSDRCGPKPNDHPRVLQLAIGRELPHRKSPPKAWRPSFTQTATNCYLPAQIAEEIPPNRRMRKMALDDSSCLLG